MHNFFEEKSMDEIITNKKKRTLSIIIIVIGTIMLIACATLLIVSGYKVANDCFSNWYIMLPLSAFGAGIGAYIIAYGVLFYSESK